MALTPEQEREIKRLQDQYVRAKAEGNMALANASHADANGIRYSAGVADQFDSSTGARLSTGGNSSKKDTSKKDSFEDFADAYAKRMADRDTKLRSRRDGIDLTPEIDQNYRDDSGRDRVRLLPKMNFLLGQEQTGIQNMMADRAFQAEQAQQDYMNILAEREYAAQQAAREWQQRQAEKQANWGAAMDISKLYGTAVAPKENWQYLLDQVSGMQQRPVLEADRSFAEQQRQFNTEADMRKQQMEFDKWAKQQGLSLDWAQLNASRANMATDNARQANAMQYERLIDLWKLTGKAPDGLPGVTPGTSLYDPSNSDRSAAKMNSEKQGLAQAIRSGDIDPWTAYKQIQEDVKLGFYTTEEAQELTSMLSTLGDTMPKGPPAPRRQ